jgi:hypothetical protein
MRFAPQVMRYHGKGLVDRLRKVFLYLYSDNHVLWAWNTKALPMNYLDTKTVPKRKIFLVQITSKKQFLFFVAHTPVIKNEDL